jgi:tRNA (guanine37-N1)-methyltransferase
MKIQVITLFPEMFDGVLNTSMLWKAQEKNLVKYKLINLRDFGIGPRKQVDDTPYGGGDGMVLKPEPLFAAVELAKKTDPDARVLLMTPRGEFFDQETAREFAATEAGLIIICGRYEGYDERITSLVDKQISIGQYVLTGGELPAMVVIDAVTRLIPGVLGSSAGFNQFTVGSSGSSRGSFISSSNFTAGKFCRFRRCVNGDGITRANCLGGLCNSG